MNEQKIKIVFGIVGGFITHYLGGVNVLLSALLTFMALDYISGVVAAWHEKQLNSGIGFKGIAKKVMMLILVAASVQLDIIIAEVNIISGLSGLIRSGVICTLAANEGLSIFENAVRIGVNSPQFLKDALLLIREHNNNNNKDIKKGYKSDE